MLSQFLMQEDGLETVEYAILAALLVGGVVQLLGTLNDAITTRYSAVEQTLSNAGD